MTMQSGEAKLPCVETKTRKPIIGILGGIGSGKSTVAAEFGKLGCAVISADDIAHNVLDEQDIQQKVVKTFGDSILTADGKIDRRKLANLAFLDSDKIGRLNSIVHPAVMSEVERRITRFNGDNSIKAIVLDIPLLVEVGWDKRCDRLIFVRCEEEKRYQNAAKSGFLTPDELKKREIFQISLDIKAALAENTIDNSADVPSLAEQVTNLFPDIIKID